MRTKKFLATITALLLAVPWAELQAWGEEGHRVVARAAFALLEEAPRAAVLEILEVDGPLASQDALDDALGRACNWPDDVRETPEWAWSAPYHYVNIPRHAGSYERQRDCPEGLCVAGGITEFAAALGRPHDDPQRRRQAFAFLCHLVGDLHQPLHTGFRDDRGANYVAVSYRGESWNLHQFWDRMVIREYLADEDGMVKKLSTPSSSEEDLEWNPADVAAWTDESHAIVLASAYPESPQIDNAFAAQCWNIIQAQWQKAAWRLALILNEVLAAPPEAAGAD